MVDFSRTPEVDWIMLMILDLSIIKRMYFTTNTVVGFFRGWQGHKIESRWFFCVKGSFEVKLVEIDDWDNPSDILEPKVYILEEKKPQGTLYTKRICKWFYFLRTMPLSY